MTTRPAHQDPATDDRARPEGTLGERAALEGLLDFHRATLAHKCAGLDAEQLRTASTPPSNLTLLGLVRHLAEVERGWFVCVVGGAPWSPLYADAENPHRDLELTAQDGVEEAFATWHEQLDLARAAAAAHSLDDVTEDPFGHRSFSLRWVYLHMIEEYARHNGHADLIREAIDGARGE